MEYAHLSFFEYSKDKGVSMKILSMVLNFGFIGTVKGRISGSCVYEIGMAIQRIIGKCKNIPYLSSIMQK